MAAQEVNTAVVDRGGPVDVALAPLDLEREMSLTARAEHSLVERLQRLEDAAVIFKRRNELMETCYLSAIRRTRPQDWILSGAGPEATGMLGASGGDLVAETYGIVIQNIRPLDDAGCFAPQRVVTGGSAYGYRAWCDAWSRVNGRSMEAIEAFRRSDEEFTGRGVDKDDGITVKSAEKEGALDSDLRSSVLTLLRTKAVRILCGMTRVPVSDLERAWKDTSKLTADCRKGHGFGSSAGRQAGAVAETGVREGAEELWKEILRRCNGEANAAKLVLKDLTSYPAKKDAAGKEIYRAFAGVESWEQITKVKGLSIAREKLKSHPMAGDREPGSEG